MRRKGVVFSKMFVLRSMGNELVPSPLISVGSLSGRFAPETLRPRTFRPKEAKCSSLDVSNS